MRHIPTGFAFAVFAVLMPAAVAAPPVEGDADLLRLLVAAQETNASLFPLGRMQFRAKDAAAIGASEAEGTVVWDHSKIQWVYSERQRLPRGGGVTWTAEELKTVEWMIGPKTQIRRIEIPGGLMSYRPDTGNAYVASGTKPGAGYADLLEVCPHQCWYRLDGPYSKASGDWRRLLDPKRTPETVTKIVVTKQLDDQVLVMLHYRSGDRVRVVASLRHGGNVIEYETLLSKESRERVPTPGIFWHQGSYDWAQTSGGEWYLKHMECRRSSSGDPESLFMDFTLDVVSFDSKARISPSEFTLASLKLAPGTTIEETGKRERTYRIAGGGKEKKGIDRHRLDALGESLRESGFAEPGRSAE
ncbi:MAG: hypothetical protein WBC44_09275 [Planctomycetaceae bacterium]